MELKVVCTPQRFLYRRAAREVCRMNARSINYVGELSTLGSGLDTMKDADLKMGEIMTTGHAAPDSYSGRISNVAELVDATGDDKSVAPSQGTDVEGRQGETDGLAAVCELLESLYMVILLLQLSAYTLLTRQKCRADALGSKYAHWCKKNRQVPIDGMQEVLDELRGVRNSLIDHPYEGRIKPLVTGFRVKVGHKKNRTWAPERDVIVDAKKATEYCRAVRQLSLQLLHHEYGEEIPAEYEAPFVYEP